MKHTFSLLIFASLILLGGGLWMGFGNCAQPVSDKSELSEKSEKPVSYIPNMTLRVLRVIDNDFTDITDSDLDLILKTATEMYKSKFGVNNVTFEDAGRVSIETFFDRWMQHDSDVYKTKDQRRFKVGTINDFESHKPMIMRFIKQWSLEELQGFFPQEERPLYDTYEKIFDGIKKQMQEKIAFIQTIKLDDRSILRPEKMAMRSFLNWLVALELQNQYDVILTNTFILYDDISHPSPHSIFSKNKVGGVSHKNDSRLALEGRVIMGSTFGMDTRIPFFMEQGKALATHEERNKVTGAYIIAHELGHAIFKLPDHYNHGPECLMNNSKSLTYKEGYELLVQHSERCPICQKWLDARHIFWEAESQFDSQKYEEAISLYSKTIKGTPKNVDGSRQAYMAYISYKISKAAHALGNHSMALKGARMAVKLYPYVPVYSDWKQTLETQSPTETAQP